MKNIKKKLKSRVGESLAETLVAVLVIALALTMLAAMITATANSVNKSRIKMDDYYKQNAKLEKMESDGTLVMQFTGDVNTDITVKSATNQAFSNTPVIAYEIN